MIKFRKCDTDTILLSNKESIFSSCQSSQWYPHSTVSLVSSNLKQFLDLSLFSMMFMFLKGAGRLFCRNVPPFGLVWSVFMFRFRLCISGRYIIQGMLCFSSCFASRDIGWQSVSSRKRQIDHLVKHLALSSKSPVFRGILLAALTKTSLIT